MLLGLDHPPACQQRLIEEGRQRALHHPVPFPNDAPRATKRPNKAAAGLSLTTMAHIEAGRWRREAGGCCFWLSYLLQLELGAPSNIGVGIEGGDDAAANGSSIHLGPTLSCPLVSRQDKRRICRYIEVGGNETFVRDPDEGSDRDRHLEREKEGCVWWWWAGEKKKGRIVSAVSKSR